MTSRRLVENRFLPVPRLPWGGLDLENVFFVQAHRIGHAAQMGAHESVITDPRNLALENDSIAYFNFSHSEYVALGGAETR